MTAENSNLPPIRGRGTSLNPTNRFVRIELSRFEDYDPTQDAAPKTEFFEDNTSTIIASNQSPDVGFERSINPYRGCEHGCVYCYARPAHEYLGFRSGIDFETKIMVKSKAPELLRRELSVPGWKPQMLAMSGVTDCYQPAERKLKLTRACLEVLLEFRNPVGIITKNHLVTRDLDILKQLAGFDAVMVHFSITSLDPELSARMEPRASSPSFRLAAIRELSRAGIPVGIMAAPMIPGLTDHELPAILKAAAEAGARTAGYVPLRLPFENKDLFENWLSEHFPDRKEKVLNQIRSFRGGKLNDGNFVSRMRGQGPVAAQLSQIFEVHCRRLGLNAREVVLSTLHFRRPGGEQLSLF